MSLKSDLTYRFSPTFVTGVPDGTEEGYARSNPHIISDLILQQNIPCIRPRRNEFVSPSFRIGGATCIYAVRQTSLRSPARWSKAFHDTAAKVPSF